MSVKDWNFSIKDHPHNFNDFIIEINRFGVQPFNAIVIVSADGIDISLGRDIVIEDIVSADSAGADDDAGMFVEHAAIGLPQEVFDGATCNGDDDEFTVNFSGKDGKTVCQLNIVASSSDIHFDVRKPGMGSGFNFTTIYHGLTWRHMEPTKGPWKISGESGNEGEAFVIEARDKTIGWTANSITEDGDEFISAEDVANANVLANARELYECLQDVLDADGDLDTMDFNRYRKVLDDIRSGATFKKNKLGI